VLRLVSVRLPRFIFVDAVILLLLFQILASFRTTSRPSARRLSLTCMWMAVPRIRLPYLLSSANAGRRNSNLSRMRDATRSVFAWSKAFYSIFRIVSLDAQAPGILSPPLRSPFSLAIRMTGGSSSWLYPFWPVFVLSLWSTLWNMQALFYAMLWLW
jgi:hypothetical protein